MKPSILFILFNLIFFGCVQAQGRTRCSLCCRGTEDTPPFPPCSPNCAAKCLPCPAVSCHTPFSLRKTGNYLTSTCGVSVQNSTNVGYTSLFKNNLGVLVKKTHQKNMMFTIDLNFKKSLQYFHMVIFLLHLHSCINKISIPQINVSLRSCQTVWASGASFLSGLRSSPLCRCRFHYAARIWDGVKKSSALSEYSRLLSQSLG